MFGPVGTGWRGTDPASFMRSSALGRILNFENMMHRRLGIVRSQRYIRLFNYYTNQNLPPDNVEQPLMINYFKGICDKHNSYLWGQWLKKLFNYRVEPRLPEAETDLSQEVSRYLDRLMEQNNANAVLWDASLNGAVYGDSIFRLRWDDLQRRVVIDSMLPEWFHCRWDVVDMNRLTEVIVAYPMDRQDAIDKYGTAGNEGIDYDLICPDYSPGFGIQWEHWTPTSYQIWVNDHLVRQGDNPYMRYDNDGNLYPGIIPFVHIPNMRVGGEYWGFSDGENILSLQDELNRRMADMGDTVNNHAHPIVALKNFSGKSNDLPVGPDAVWDLGRDGAVQVVQWEGTPPAVMEYIRECKQVMLDTCNMPELAFGRGGRASGKQGTGSSSSGLAMQLAMFPVVERSNQKRIFWSMGLKQIADLAIFIHAVMDPATLPFTYEQFREQEIIPEFSSVLPRDRMQIVNEVVALSNALLMSIPTALKRLSEEHIEEEYKAIQKDGEFKAALGIKPASTPDKAPIPGAPPMPGGKNSDHGQGGQPGQQDGPGAPNAKPGARAKEA